MNPLLPRQFFVPDVEAHVMPDGRLYVYGSLDQSGSSEYSSKEMRCYSTDDMEHWTDHGVIFRNDAAQPGVPWHPDRLLYAPDAIHRKGTYYLFVCGDGGFEGVAQAPTPIGPFSAAKPVRGADGEGIDPAVFVDNDGQAYFLWGQFHLRGGKLTENMDALIPETIRDNIVTEWEHGFHEGASLRKRNGRYYLTYTDITRGRATCIGYAVSDHPLGPYKRCGVIVDNTHCDPKTWNNHGSIECFHGQWYVFYHRSSQNSLANRRACAEPISFDENGLIAEVPLSSNGASRAMDACAEIDASVACRMKGGSFIRPGASGEVLVFTLGSHWYKSWAEYRWVDFGEGVSAAILRARGKGRISLQGENAVLGETLLDQEDFAEVSIPVQMVSGIHPLWICVDGGKGSEVEIDRFRFLRLKK